MEFPGNLLYATSHEWARIEDNEAVIGISSFAQDQLGDVTYVDLPAVGSDIAKGEEIGSIESVKAASELYAPVSGNVVAVNEALADHPELVNQDPFGAGWMVRVRLSGAPEGLMDAKAYAAHVASSSH